MAQRMHLARAQRIHRVGARTHAHKRHIAGRHPRTHQHQAGRQVGGRANGRHANAPPRQIAQVLVGGQRAQRHPQSQLGCPPLQHQRTVGLAPHLRAQHMFKRARADIGRPLLHGLLRQRTRRKIAHHHLQAFHPEVAQRIRQRQRQVIKHPLPPHRHGDAPQHGPIGLRSHQRRRAHRSRRDGGYGAKGTAGDQRLGHGVRQKR